MRGETCWERNIEANGGIINVHITAPDSNKVYVDGTPVYFTNPSRIGIDFNNYKFEGSKDYIPNASVSDLTQIINRLRLFRSQIIRDAYYKGVLEHNFGIELDFRRRLDLNLAISLGKKEIVEMYYGDPRRFERALFGSIEVESLIKLIRAMKECIVEYNYLTNKLLIE